MTENEIATLIFQCARNVFDKLGPGLLESTYEDCLCYELDKRNVYYNRQLLLPLVYEEVELENAYRIDILVEGKVVVELKSVENILPVHKAQVLTYLRLLDCRLGMLINFNVTYLGEGVTRIVNGLVEK